MYQRISIDDLVPHPENTNRMSTKFMNKLEENIRKSGLYETITVRSHPELEGMFQILNGHHRVEVLKKVSVDEVKCDVWKVSDSQARLLIATLNRLEGQDVPELRMSLLESLMKDFDVSELESLIPESDEQLENLMTLCQQDFDAIQKEIKETTSYFESELADLRILDFFLNSKQHKLIVETLDQLIASGGLKNKNEALYELARKYSFQS